MNSPSASARSSEIVGCGARESTAPANSSLLPSRRRPAGPMRTTLSGTSWPGSLTV